MTEDYYLTLWWPKMHIRAEIISAGINLGVSERGQCKRERENGKRGGKPSNIGKSIPQWHPFVDSRRGDIWTTTKDVPKNKSLVKRAQGDSLTLKKTCER